MSKCVATVAAAGAGVLLGLGLLLGLVPNAATAADLPVEPAAPAATGTPGPTPSTDIGGGSCC
ncbi:hypothetical protein [Kitasatospora sp. NPDC001175]|uniref:Uncharacterized protein n=1 Tax=Kitasatospora cystarginea TaxID=58350 RepID=A0ABN3EPE7_9ACTN